MAKNKYFICSDIHSYFTPLKKALKDDGFNIKTKSHILVVCGDLFDRGEETMELYNFIMSLPKERRILIRGNHEYLLKKLYERGYAMGHDDHNGTVDTLYQLALLPTPRQSRENFYKSNATSDVCSYDDYRDLVLKHRQMAFDCEFTKTVIDWMMGDEWLDYWETPNYVFVHSFIPTKIVGTDECCGIFFNYEYYYDPNWRNATEEQWEEATWGCPYEQWRDGLFKEDKTLVCGHWHTSDFWNELVYKNDVSKQLSAYESNPLFKIDGINLIGLDACCAATKTINVLVLKEEEL